MFSCIKILSIITTPMIATIENTCNGNLSQANMAKWLVLMEKTNNDIMLHIYHSITKLSKPR